MAFRHADDTNIELENVDLQFSSSQNERIIRKKPQLPVASTSKGSKGEKEEIIVVSSDEEMEEMKAVAAIKEDVKGKGKERLVDSSNTNLNSISQLDQEIASVDDQINSLKELKRTLQFQRSQLSAQTSVPLSKKQILTASTGTIDFRTVKKHEAKLKAIAKSKFRVQPRPIQNSIMEAILAGRDTFAILPTGAGKSLLFQLPALLSSGTTLVITPLLALMYDQCLNLKDLGIRAEYISADTSSADANAILKRMISGKSEKENEDDEVKLIYATPEKFSKSKTFVSNLSKAYSAGNLTRIVIDEVHCASSQSHDFRPAYQDLSLLKKLFPQCPILCLSATCSVACLKDLLRVLQLAPTTSGECANSTGTILFTSPLHRKNLVYSVIQKTNVDSQLTDWVLKNRPNEKGIVYCFARNESEKVAAELEKESGKKITTAYYHADIDAATRSSIHRNWKSGRVDIVVSTIAFGLGIDAPTTNFVLHHTLSKSLDGYLQESGRAGRAGQTADCVLFFKPSDFTRLSGMVAGEIGGSEKLKKMVQYAMEFKKCRKILFAEYFEEHEQQFSNDSQENCGNCDNCTRSAASFLSKDVSLETYQSLRIISACHSLRGTLTLAQAVDLVRGLGGGSCNIAKGKGKGHVDVLEVAGSKVKLSKEDTEFLLLKLLVDGYLSEEYNQNGYNIISYLKPSKLATRFTRLSPVEMEAQGSPVKILLDLPAKVKIVKAKVSKVSTAIGKNKSAKHTSKKREMEEEEEEEDSGIWETVTTKKSKK